MGSTVAAVLITPAAVVAANVGDSPIWHLNAAGVTSLAVRHNLAAEQERSPLGGRSGDTPWRHMLTRAVGIEATVQADTAQIPCREGDRVVLASDGLSDALSPAEIALLAANHQPATACRRMVELANLRGGEDNITVIVVALGA
jgi:protein phosphatase